MPIQKPHPPLWVACTSKDTHALAGHKGLGLLSFTLLVSPEELGRRVQMYRDALKTAQPAGAFVNNKAGAFSLVHCAETDKQAQAEAERSFMSYVGTTLQVTTPVLEARKSGRTLEEISADPNREIKEYEGVDPRKVDLQFMIDNGMCVVGSPDTCIKQIERIQKEAKLDLFMCMMQFWAIPHEKTMHAIKLFGKHVLPYFQRA